MHINKPHKSIIILSSVIVLLCGLCILLIYQLGLALGSIRYIPAIFESEPSSVCKYKKVIWGANKYIIKNTNNIPLYIQIDNYNKSHWSYSFDPIAGNQLIGEAAFDEKTFGDKKHKDNVTKHFTYCSANIIAPQQFQPPDLQKSAKGILVTLRNTNNQILATFVMGAGVQAFRYSDEDYNFNDLMQDLAKSFVIKKETDGTFILTLQPNYKLPKPYHYEITKINNAFIDVNNFILISRDQGKTWEYAGIDVANENKMKNECISLANSYSYMMNNQLSPSENTIIKSRVDTVYNKILNLCELNLYDQTQFEIVTGTMKMEEYYKDAPKR